MAVATFEDRVRLLALILLSHPRAGQAATDFGSHRLRSLYTPQKYFFVTSAYQACVLLQFNSGVDNLSYDEIQVGTGLAPETLKPVLQLLTKQRVLDFKDNAYELNLGKLEFPGFLVCLSSSSVAFLQVSGQKRSESC